MPNLLQNLRQNRDEIYAIAQKYGVSNIRVFGSVARGEEQKNSDLDLLVDIDYKAYGSGFARVDFKQKIENFLHLKVDVLTKKSLNSHIKKQILKEAQKL
jgi:predicted nucleotidyltransferase